ncbi:hypothetical protein K9N50_05575 [bacterium]|nr:hypothetical protein [bacterium]
MLTRIIIPIITAIIGGLAVWVIRQLIENFKQKKMFKTDCSFFSGNWHGIHLTRDKDVKISRHRYKLNVNKNGIVNGTLIELSTNPEWKYKVEGRIGAGGWILKSECLSRPDEFAVEVYFNDLDASRISGFLFSYDLARQAFCSFSVISREPISDTTFYNEYMDNLNRIYLPKTVSLKNRQN